MHEKKGSHVEFDDFIVWNRLPKEDNKNRDLILHILDDANLEVDKVMAPYANDIPVEGGMGGRISEYCKHLALAFATYRWYLQWGQTERAALQKSEYNTKLKSLMGVLKSRRTNKTKTVMVSRDPNDDQLILPGFKYDTILD